MLDRSPLVRWPRLMLFNQPFLFLGVDASEMQFYSHGIFYEDSCSSVKLNHGNQINV